MTENQVDDTSYMDLLFQNKLPEAYAACINALETCTPCRQRIHEGLLCHILNSMGRYNESDVILERLVLESPDDHRLLHNWAAVKRMLGQYQNALEMFEKEKVMIEKSNDDLSIAANTYELGKTNHMLENREEAFKYATQSFLVSQKCEDPIMHGCAYRLLGDLYSSFCKEIGLTFYDQAKNYFSKGMDPRAVKDIDQRIESVINRKDPKFIS